MTGIGPRQRTRLCPNCRSIQVIGGDCGVCKTPIQTPVVIVDCPDCGKRKPELERCPWCGGDP